MASKPVEQILPGDVFTKSVLVQEVVITATQVVVTYQGGSQDSFQRGSTVDEPDGTADVQATE